MVQLFESGAYLIDGKELIADNADAAVQVAAKTGRTISKEERQSRRWHIRFCRRITHQGTTSI